MSEFNNESRRGFLRKAAYVPPLVATMSVLPRVAAAGSHEVKLKCDNGVGNDSDCLPPGLVKNEKSFLDNDDVYGVPGSPQNQGGPNK